MNTWAHLFWATKDSSLSWKRQNVHAPCFLSKNEGRDDIYTADRNLRQNRYRCRQCGKVYAVGKEAEYQTIRELKKQGCNVCGATVFDRLHKNGNTDKKQYLPLGHHILADFYNCDPENWTMWNRFAHSCTKRQ